MHKAQEMVREFRSKMGFIPRDKVGFVDAPLCERLLCEELTETIEAMFNRDMVETIDGLCDLIYVAYNAAESFGVDLEKYFAEVHRTNMLKEPNVIDEHGKRGLKPAGWEPPRIAEILAAETRDK